MHGLLTRSVHRLAKTRTPFFPASRPLTRNNLHRPLKQLTVLVSFLTFAGLLAPPIHLDAAVGQGDKYREDPATLIQFHEFLRIPSRPQLPTCKLLGLGVRKVSFLKVKVYSVAFYADINNPNLQLPHDASFEDQVAYLIENTTCILRIIPTRPTSYTHLRDGFMRALHAREIKARNEESVQQPDNFAAHVALNKFKSIFPNLPLAKHSSMDIILTPPMQGPRTLIVRDLGSVDNTWLATEFFKAYFEGQGISPPLKEDVRQGLQLIAA